MIILTNREYPLILNIAMPSFHVDNKKRDSLVEESRLKR